ncbi:MAG: GAF domain-containing protein [Terriglobales bacterium]
MKTYRSARELLEGVEQALAPKSRLSPRGRRSLREMRGGPLGQSPLDDIARLLRSGRQFLAVTIYLNVGERVWRVASAGPESSCESMKLGEALVGGVAASGQSIIVPDVSKEKRYREIHKETRSEAVIPIKIGAHVLGVVDVESDHLNGISYQEHVLLKKVAYSLARFLSGHGKYLLMKAREAQATPPPPAKQPSAEAARGPMRAAAGEKARS